MTQYVRRSEIRKERGRAGLAAAAAACLLSALFFGYIWQRIYLGQQLAAIEEMAARNQELAAEGKALLLAVQGADSWSEVEMAAIERLGMTYPEKDQVVTAILPPRRKGQEATDLARALLSPVNAAWSQP